MKHPPHIKIEDVFRVQHLENQGGAAIKHKASKQLPYGPPTFHYPFAPMLPGYGTSILPTSAWTLHSTRSDQKATFSRFPQLWPFDPGENPILWGDSVQISDSNVDNIMT